MAVFVYAFAGSLRSPRSLKPDFRNLSSLKEEKKDRLNNLFYELGPEMFFFFIFFVLSCQQSWPCLICLDKQLGTRGKEGEEEQEEEEEGGVWERGYQDRCHGNPSPSSAIVRRRHEINGRW